MGSLKIEQLIIYTKGNRLLILDHEKGILQYDLSSFQFEQRKTIEFDDGNGAIYWDMILDVGHNERLDYILIAGNRYILEVLLKEDYEFFFARRFDYAYFMRKHIFETKLIQSKFLLFKSMTLTQNFISIIIEENRNFYQLTFSRKKDRIAPHHIQNVEIGSIFLSFQFSFVWGDFLFRLQNDRLELIKLSDLHIVFFCCSIPLQERIEKVSVEIKIYENLKFKKDDNIIFTLVPLNYPHVFRVNRHPSFIFDNPIIYIKLYDIAIGPEIEFTYLSDNSNNIKLSTDHMTKVKMDLINKKVNFLSEIIDAQIVEMLNTLKMVATFKENGLIKFGEIECSNISYGYLRNCLINDRMNDLTLKEEIDFFSEINNIIFLHPKLSDKIIVFNTILKNEMFFYLTPTKKYSMVHIWRNFIFAVPFKNSSIEIYSFTKELKHFSVEKLLNIDSNYLNIDFDLNITQICFSLLDEGLLIIVTKLYDSLSLIMLLQIFLGEKEIISFKFTKQYEISNCKIIALSTKKLVIICPESITETIIEGFFEINRVRNYPLYRYNPDISKLPFSDSKLIYVHAYYFSIQSKKNEPVLLIYDPSKTASSLLTALEKTNEIRIIKNGRRDLSLTIIKKENQLIMKIINLQPQLKGKIIEKSRDRNQKQNEEIFDINVSFTNQNSNRNLVSTLHILVNLKDYNIFLFDESFKNLTIVKNIARDTHTLILVNQTLFKGPVEYYTLETDYESENYYNFFLVDYLERYITLADYHSSIFEYGLVLDMLVKNQFIIVLTKFRLIIYDKNEFPKVLYEETLDSSKKYSKCAIAHHSTKRTFLFNCKDSLQFEFYEYQIKDNDSLEVSKIVLKTPYSLGLISRLVSKQNFLFIQSRLLNTLNETEFTICEFPNKSQTTLKIIGTITSEDFNLLSINSQDFEIYELDDSGNFGLFILKKTVIIFMKFCLNKKIISDKKYSLMNNPFDSDLTSISIENMTIYTNTSSIVFYALLGTDDHLYEVELILKRNELTLLKNEYLFRKYCKCENTASKPLKMKDYVVRICRFAQERELEKKLIDENKQELFHFIQLYKKIPNTNESHPIRVLKFIYDKQIDKEILFFQNDLPVNNSLHILVATYLNYLVDYLINGQIGIKIFPKNWEERGVEKFDARIVARNEFSSQDFMVNVVHENDIEDYNVKLIYLNLCLFFFF